MDKKHLHHYYTRLRDTKSGYLLVPAVVLLVISIYSLRQNNYKMIKLRDAVVAVDQQNGDVEVALQNLRKHVYAHMNTNLSGGKNAIKPPIQLKARYDRLTSVEQERIKQANANITTTAEGLCASQFPNAGYNAPRVACVQEYVRTHGQVSSSIPDELYKFDFVSPRWSPDVAGISLVLSGVFFLLFFVRLIVVRILRYI